MSAPEPRPRDRLPPWRYGVFAGIVTFLWVLWTFVWSSPFPTGDGRPDPAAMFSEPALVITEPGMLAAAIEAQVNDAVSSCLAEQGVKVKGLAVPSLQELGSDGYGVSTAPTPEVFVDGTHTSPFPGLRGRYEEAMYGGLDDEALGGCGERAVAALEASVRTIRGLDYGVEELEADIQADPAYREAQEAWSECMAGRGHDYGSPEAVISSLLERHSNLRGDDSRALAAEEREVAAADAACRDATLDAAISVIAPDHGERFVDANREDLERLIPTAPTPIPGDLGGGDVQVTLLWEDTVDLDLSVRDPNGDTVDFQNSQVASGGELDRDANFPCTTAGTEPVENVFWPSDGAPNGEYLARVAYRTGCDAPGPVPYRLIIRIGGETLRDDVGTIDPGETIEVPFRFGDSG